MNQLKNPQRLDVYMADLPDVGGSIQNGYRPVIIIQNDIGNANSTTLIVVPLTSKQKRNMPTHVYIKSGGGLRKQSVALCEQIMTISKSWLCHYVSTIEDKETIDKLHQAIKVSLGME